MPEKSLISSSWERFELNLSISLYQLKQNKEDTINVNYSLTVKLFKLIQM